MRAEIIYWRLRYWWYEHNRRTIEADPHAWRDANLYSRYDGYRWNLDRANEALDHLKRLGAKEK